MTVLGGGAPGRRRSPTRLRAGLPLRVSPPAPDPARPRDRAQRRQHDLRDVPRLPAAPHPLPALRAVPRRLRIDEPGPPAAAPARPLAAPHRQLGLRRARRADPRQDLRLPPLRGGDRRPGQDRLSLPAGRSACSPSPSSTSRARTCPPWSGRPPPSCARARRASPSPASCAIRPAAPTPSFSPRSPARASATG